MASGISYKPENFHRIRAGKAPERLSQKASLDMVKVLATSRYELTCSSSIKIILISFYCTTKIFRKYFKQYSTCLIILQDCIGNIKKLVKFYFPETILFKYFLNIVAYNRCNIGFNNPLLPTFK